MQMLLRDVFDGPEILVSFLRSFVLDAKKEIVSGLITNMDLLDFIAGNENNMK